MNKKLLFALDIGTRSIVGLVGEKTGTGIRLLAAERREHMTRAMLDGQIHDVPEVANVIASVKDVLEKKFGTFSDVAIAAAGRALSTMRAVAEMDVHTRGYLTLNEERTLELMSIQSAQKQLATSKVVNDPASYYCVGHSIVGYTLDSTPMKSLVGQRGHNASIEIIATFLPRQVIDSLQAAVKTVGLEIGTLTLEPIAAINVLIPATMRHLNLVLVDVGAGTSDVAITRDGSVVAYGMVPIAGDEITEELSAKHLLDFKVAEVVKRRLNKATKPILFTDVLGVKYKKNAKEMIDSITPVVTHLAQSIAKEILSLNNAAPQAILLVGGGSQTPLLPEILADIMGMPRERVAVRRPDSIEDISNIPVDFCTPDAVTPLGILKLAGAQALNFLNVVLNGQPLRLFNLGSLTVGDALLAAGIDARSLAGRPGLGLTLNINGERRFLPGSHGDPGQLTVNGKKVSFGESIAEGDVLLVDKGKNGATPKPRLKELVELPSSISVTIQNKKHQVGPLIVLGDKMISGDELLHDRDEVVWKPADTIDRVLRSAQVEYASRRFTYTVNGLERAHATWPGFLLNGQPADGSFMVRPADNIEIVPPPVPSIAEVINFKPEDVAPVDVIFNGVACSVPSRRFTLTLNGSPASLNDPAPDSAVIEFNLSDQSFPTLADVLLAAEFNPRDIPVNQSVSIALNGKVSEFTAKVKNGDKIDVVVKDISPRGK